VFVLDGTFTLRYRGRIDDAWTARLKQNHQAGVADLRQALGELLSGRPVSNPTTRAVGCNIARATEPPVKNGPVTYYRDALPILQRRCQGCHRPGEVGPFSLLTYRQAVNWASDIEEYTRTGQMPPWKITAGLPFHNDRRMPANEIATLAAWVDGGTPEGDKKDAPPPAQFPQGWQLGTPDLVLTLPDDFQIGPTGKDVFRCFVLPTNFTEDRYVAGVEIRPGNPRIVHHSLLFVDGTGQARKLEEKEKARGEIKDPHTGVVSLDKGPGYSVAMGVGFLPQGGMSGWAPGQLGRYLPDGFGYYLPKGADVVMQIHYHRNGKLEKDRTSIGLYLAKSPKTRPIQGGVLAGGQGGTGPMRLFFSIPPGAERHRLTGTQRATEDCTLHMITPHMHLLGKEIKVTMTPPGGPPQTLLEIKDWDYNWQETYTFKNPVQVKAGSRLDVEAFFDNSSNNPRNPFSPPRRVTFGEQTTNEMCFIFLGGTSARPGRRLPLTPNDPAGGEKKQALGPPTGPDTHAAGKDGPTFAVPYRLTNVLHVMVRTKINGKGPYNFIVDTGAPMVILTKEVAKKIGLVADKKGWTTVDRLEVEGGLTRPKVKVLLETPFQLEGMNAMGLAGAEIHGILGYTFLAQFRLGFDFTRDKMTWTELQFKPPAPQPLGKKDAAPPDLGYVATLMKVMSFLVGKQPPRQIAARGYLGIELAESNGVVTITKVLADTPAARAGLLAGDRIEQVQGKAAKTAAEVHRRTAKVTAGQEVRLGIRRGDQSREITVTAGEGL
jgi:hypothetical protein